MPDEVVEITEPIVLAIVDDRLHFTCISGERRRTYSISFHKAANSAHQVGLMLDERQRQSRVHLLERRDGHAASGRSAASSISESKGSARS